MKVFSCLLCLIILITSGVNVFGQVSTPFISMETAADIIPTSPEASELMKMVTYPVNHNTGIPNIQIPIHEIRSGNLVLPIKASYHAGGFKVSSKPTKVGLGWSLSSDLQITREINHQDDFFPMGYYHNTDMRSYGFDDYGKSSKSGVFDNSSTARNKLYSMCYDETLVDGKPDKFIFNLLGKSGSFYIRKDQYGNFDSFVPVPYNGLKINYTETHALGEFEITDTDGTVYYFGVDGPDVINGSPWNSSEVDGILENLIEYSQGHVTAWKCRKIINASRTDSITFEYRIKATDYISSPGMDRLMVSLADGEEQDTRTPDSNPIKLYAPGTYTENDKYFMGNTKPVVTSSYYGEQDTVRFWLKGGWVKGYDIYETYGGTNSYVIALTMTKINFRNGSVNFDVDDDFGGTQRLESLTIQSDYGQVKKVDFYQSHFESCNGSPESMYLDSLKIYHSEGSIPEIYTMDYNKFCFGSDLFGNDAWGYVNHTTKPLSQRLKKLLLPIRNLPVEGCVESNYCSTSDMTMSTLYVNGDLWANTPNKDGMIKGILKKMVYPSGMVKTFDFEPNQYLAEFKEYGSIIPLPQLAGGLRIKNINTFDPDKSTSVPVIQKHYRYGAYEDGTGVLLNPPLMTREGDIDHLAPVTFDQMTEMWSCDPMAFPAWHAGTGWRPVYPSCTSLGELNIVSRDRTRVFLPVSALAYTYADGSPIRYTKVTEYSSDLGIETGKTVYEYYHPGFEHKDYYTGNPYNTYDPVVVKDPNGNLPGGIFSMVQENWYRGGLKSITQFEYSPEGKFRQVHKKEYEYRMWTVDDHVMVVHVSPVVNKVISASSSTETFDRKLIYSPQDFYYLEYGILVGDLKPVSEKEQWYDGEEITTTFSYDARGQLSTISTVNTKEDIISKTFQYPYDFSDDVYDEMKNLNIISPVIEVFAKNETRETPLYRNRVYYGRYLSSSNILYKPAALWSSINGGDLEFVKSNDDYDDLGNLLQTTERSGMVSSFIWGYKGLFPVVKLDGIAYNDIPNTYRSSTVFWDPAGDDDLQEEVKNLQEELANQNVTVSGFAYQPFQGVKRQIDPNGFESQFEYDAEGRLAILRDFEDNILGQIEYNLGDRKEASRVSPTFEQNSPIMMTFDTCGVAYNYLIPGGISTDGLAHQYGVDNHRAPKSINCDEPHDLVSIYLEGAHYYSGIFNANPRVYADFIQDGHVVFSRRFDRVYWSGSDGESSTVHLKIPAGTYTINIRGSGDVKYNGSGSINVATCHIRDSSGNTIESVSFDRMSALSEWTIPRFTEFTFSSDYTYTINLR